MAGVPPPTPVVGRMAGIIAGVAGGDIAPLLKAGIPWKGWAIPPEAAGRAMPGLPIPELMGLDCAEAPAARLGCMRDVGGCSWLFSSGTHKGAEMVRVQGMQPVDSGSAARGQVTQAGPPRRAWTTRLVYTGRVGTGRALRPARQSAAA